MEITEISKESDIFRIKFENGIPNIIEYLQSKDEWVVEETIFKEFFDLDCDTISTYNKIRYTLECLDNDLKVKIQNNVIIDKKHTNLFRFYFENKTEELKKKIHEKRIKLQNENKKRVNDAIKEDIMNVEWASKQSINEISTNIPLPYTSICLNCKNKTILAYPELNCPFCKTQILKSWD